MRSLKSNTCIHCRRELVVRARHAASRGTVALRGTSCESTVSEIAGETRVPKALLLYRKSIVLASRTRVVDRLWSRLAVSDNFVKVQLHDADA